jgi:hypothetical protein
MAPSVNPLQHLHFVGMYADAPDEGERQLRPFMRRLFGSEVHTTWLVAPVITASFFPERL